MFETDRMVIKAGAHEKLLRRIWAFAARIATPGVNAAVSG
jgi:hypothetical protein